jgi:hypothetical protein
VCTGDELDEDAPFYPRGVGLALSLIAAAIAGPIVIRGSFCGEACRQAGKASSINRRWRIGGPSRRMV